jgi:hypothetical protein
VAYGWDRFIKLFEGFNVEVSQAFAQTFDGAKSKIGDLQLEVTEDFIAEAMGFPQKGAHWLKNLKFEGVLWHLLMDSKRSRYSVKGTPIVLFKPRWHGLLLILKQFVTCEGRYRLVFLYHVRLLMVFLGFDLNMPFYLLKSLQKMAKFYQSQNVNAQSSLFHHGLIRILVISQLSNVGDNWQDFVTRNGFAPPETVIDSPLHFDEPSNPCLSTPSLENLHVELQEIPVSITKTLVVFHKSSKGKNLRRDFIPKKSLEGVLDNLKDKVLVVPSSEPVMVDLNEVKIKKHGRRKTQRIPDIDFKNNRPGRLIFRTLRNRHRDHEKPIPVIDVNDQISEDDTNAYAPQFNFVSNLPPFLKKQQGFSGIQHDLKRIMEQGKLPTTEQARPLPSMEPVHCENFFE